MKPTRIRTYLVALVAACGLGGVVLFAALYPLEAQHEKAAKAVSEDSLILRDLARFDELFTQWMVLSDLILGADESYVAEGAIELGTGLLKLTDELEDSRMSGMWAAEMDRIRRFLERQQTRLEVSLTLIENRAERLDVMLLEMDDESIPAIDALEQLKLRATQQHRKDNLALHDRSALRHQSRAMILGSFLAYVFVLWRWSSRRLSRPVRALSREARDALQQGRRMSIRESGPIEVRQLTKSMSQLVGSLERKVEDRTEHLQKALKEARAAAQAKSDFLANMSHEIRTPMTAVIGFSERLRDDRAVREDSQERDAAIRAIVGNGHHLLNLINRILDLSRLEAGKLELEMTPVSPFEVVDGAVGAIRIAAEGKDLALSVNYESRLPQAIMSDATRLQQILINLLGNAVKFTEEGSVTLTISMSQNGQTIRFEIADTGIGIDKEQLSRLFQPFTQADSSMSRRYGGTGLGLVLSQNLAELLGGNIRAESEVGAGSRFTLIHPCAPADDATLIDVATWEKENRDTEPEVDDEQPLKDLRILVVEDMPMNQLLVESMMTSLGAEVTMTENGQLGLEAALAARDEEQPFDVVLMDMQMPVMDGYTATTRLREEDYHGVVIALTGHALDHDRQKCLDAGCDDYSTKPIDRDGLIQTIRTCLAESKERVAAAAIAANTANG